MALRLERDEEQPFELIKHLGTGGFAQTWLARVLDEDLIEEWKTDQVAVKIPLSKQKESVLRKEVELGGGLFLRLTEVESRNIVRYLGFYVYDGKVVMVMNFVSGGSLRQALGPAGRSKPLDYDRAIDMMRGILSGLAVIHRNQIIHRDIKPENILIENGVPQISDFGIGRMLHPNELASSVVGTIFYMSPEMLFEDAARRGMTFSTDIWSVGITLYEMLYGCFPFLVRADMPIGQIAANIVNKSIPLAFPENDAVPAKFSALISRALQRDPGDRYPDAAEMLADLDSLTGMNLSKLDKILAAWQTALLTSDQITAIEEQIPKLVRQYPDSGKLYLYIGEFHNKCGHFERAAQAFRKGISLDPGQAMLYWGLAMACEKQKDYAAATENLEKALSSGLEKSHERYARILLESLRHK